MKCKQKILTVWIPLFLGICLLPLGMKAELLGQSGPQNLRVENFQKCRFFSKASETTIGPGKIRHEGSLDLVDQYLTLEILVVIYTQSVQATVTQPEIDFLKNEVEEGVEFYWRNSNLKLFLDIDYLVIDRYLSLDQFWLLYPPGGYWLPFWSEDGVNSVENDLYNQGIADDQYDGVVVFYAWANDQDVYAALGGGAYGVDMGFMGQTGYVAIPLCWDPYTNDGYFIHEVLHVVDSMFHFSGFPEMPHADNPGDYAGIYDEGDSFNGWILRTWPTGNWFQLSAPWGFLDQMTDGDGDQIPDTSPVLPITEYLLGSSPNNQDTDGDWLYDFDEVLAGYRKGADPTDTDSDGDNDTDGTDATPIDAVNETILKRTVTVDGVIQPGEWDLAVDFSDTYRGEPFSGRFYLNWDASYLYVGAKIDDDVVETPWNDPTWNDGIFIRVDATNDGFLAHGQDNHYILVSPLDAGGKALTYSAIVLEDGTHDTSRLPQSSVPAQFSKTSNSFTIEVGIPENGANGLSLTPGEELRMQLTVKDYDVYGGWAWIDYGVLSRFIDFTLRESDTQPPTMEAIVEPQGQWYNTAPGFSNFGFDDNQGLDDGWYQINSCTGPWIPLFTNVSGTSWDDHGWTIPGFDGLPEGSNTIYFKADDDADNVGGGCNWSWQFYKDTVPPKSPADVTSPSHQLSVWSNDPTVEVSWTDATDPSPGSGLDGYSIEWDTFPSTVPDEVKDIEEGVEAAMSSALSDGDDHYFHIRSVDNAGNWQSTVHLGPFWIDGSGPSDGTISINSGADTTASAIVSLDNLSAIDALSGMGPGAQMRFSNDGASWSDSEDYTVSRADWDLTASEYGGNPFEGMKTVYVQFRDVAGNWSDSFQDDIFYHPPLTVVTGFLPDGFVGDAYSETLLAVGGTPPYVWSLISGSLPDGLWLDSLSGVISGTPATAETAYFTVEVTDAELTTDTQELSITVLECFKADVNSDGLVNIIDVVWLVNFILGDSCATMEGPECCAADCNDDGAVNIMDAVGIVNFILGIGTCPPGGTAKTVVTTARLWSQSIEPRAQSIELPIFVDTETEIRGAQFRLSYDPAALTPGQPQLTGRCTHMTLASNAKDGKLTIVLYSTEGKAIPAG